MVTKKQILKLANRVAIKNYKADKLQKELETIIARYLGYKGRDDYEEKSKNPDWSDWFIDTIEMGSLKVTLNDINNIISELKAERMIM